MVERTRARPALGTLAVVSAEGSPSDVDRGLARAFEAIAAVESRLSYFDPSSDVSRMNREAADRAVPVHADTFAVLKAARRLALESAGLFDVTAAGALCRAGFLPPVAGASVPDPTATFADIQLGEGRRVRFRRPLWIELGGIAKGFAVDRALAALRQSGVCRGQVNAGGDMAFFGSSAAPFWVRHPQRRDRFFASGRPSDGACATSAPAYRARGRGDQRRTPYVKHGHSQDLGTGVTVFAPRAMWADALTKVVLLAPKRSLSILRRFRARAAFVSRCGGALAWMDAR